MTTTYKKRTRSPEKQAKLDAFKAMAAQLAGEVVTQEGKSPRTLDDIDLQRCSAATIRRIGKVRQLPGLERFSARNQLLIEMQAPGTEEAYTYHQWLELGFQVREGAHSNIYVKAPNKKKDEDGESILQGMHPLSLFTRDQVDPIAEKKEEEEEEDENQ